MQIPALICVTRGPRHIIQSVNACYLDAIGGRDVIGLSMGEAFPDAPPERMAMLNQTYRTGEAYSGNEVSANVFTDAGQQERFFNLTVRPLRDRAGRVYGLVSHAVDETDNVRTRRALIDLAQALERSNHELDSFAYAASHDLRAPLRGIANLSQWVEEDLLSTGLLKDDTRDMLQLMRVRMHRMEGLIEGLLRYSRAGRGHAKAETVDTRQLVSDVVDLLSPAAGTSVTIAGALPTITTERLPLQQVFMNLIGNAIKHTNRPDARVEIASEAHGPFMQFSVRDNGPGIASEFHDRIWGIFQTLEARDNVEGAGIGLALVKKIVESQGGRVWVESEPGRGATFKFLWRTT
jgi:signal transduction histidine kinase